MGREEGRKDRPCAIVVAAETHGGITRVVLVPLTHTSPRHPGQAMEVPVKVKRHLGLDDEPCWIILTELNSFNWPGYDLRPIPGNGERCDYGMIPKALLEAIKQGILEQDKAARKTTPRD